MIAAIAFATALAALPAKLDRATCFDPVRGFDTHFEPINDHTILVRSQGRAFRLTTTPSFRLAGPSPILVSEIRGPSEVCRPVDLDLRVTDSGGGFGEPIIVQAIDRITLDEAKALSRGRGKR